MFGARVVKTCLAVACAILVARLLHLSQPHFAGIVAVLSVQPSLYRSFRDGLRQFVSAFLGALVGGLLSVLLGSAFWVMGLAALLLMAFHVKIKWTNSLPLSVVIALNTLGSVSHFMGESALNQLALVTVGTLAGTLVNLVRQPGHQERAADLLVRSEGMVRALLYYVALELSERKVTPYPEMRQQVDEVRSYIEHGKAICGLIQEDRVFRRVPNQDYLVSVFLVMERLVERIRDVSLGLQKVDPDDPEVAYCCRAILLTVRIQENKLLKQRAPSKLLSNVLYKHEQHILQDRSHSMHREFPFLTIYHHLREYLRQLDRLEEVMQDFWEGDVEWQEGGRAR